MAAIIGTTGRFGTVMQPSILAGGRTASPFTPIHASHSHTILPFMRDSSTCRDYGSLVREIFNIRDRINTCHEISYEGFSLGNFDRTGEIAIMFLKPTTHTNGNFTKDNTGNILGRLTEAGWFPRAVRIFRGQALPPEVVTANYPDPFYGRGVYGTPIAASGLGTTDIEMIAKPGKKAELQAYLKGVYGDGIDKYLFIHSCDLADGSTPIRQTPVRNVYGKLPLGFITALWAKGYGKPENTPESINLLDNRLSANQKTRIFLVTNKIIGQTLEDMGWNASEKERVKKVLEDLKLSDGFVMCNGFACELLHALGRQDEFIPVFLLQRSKNPNAAGLEKLRKEVIGNTNPSKALPGSIRGDAYLWHLGNRGIKHPIIVPDVVLVNNNICHCSEDKENALREAELWFGKTLFHTLLIGSDYPKPQILDIEQQPVIGDKASAVNAVDYLLTNGLTAFSRKFVPIPDTGPDSATITYRNWMELRRRYMAEEVNMGHHLVDQATLEIPSAKMIPELRTAQSKPRSRKARLIVGMAGQNYRYYDISARESARAKGSERIKGIALSPIELRLNELINDHLSGKNGTTPVLFRIITNNYNNEYVRSHLTGYLKHIGHENMAGLFDLYGGDNVGGQSEQALVKYILDQMVFPSGSLPRMIPQNEDLLTEPIYQREQLKRWSRFYAPAQYFANEEWSAFGILDKASYERARDFLIKKGLAEIIPEEREIGSGKTSNICCWTEPALAMSEKNIATILKRIHNNKIFAAMLSSWRLSKPTALPKIALKDKSMATYLDNVRRSDRGQSYTFAHYLQRTVTDTTKEKGNPGDYCFDRTQNLTCKSPGHMDTLTSYVLHGLREDINGGMNTAFLSCAEDFAFRITNDLIRHIEMTSVPLTFLVNQVRGDSPERPSGGFVFSPKNPETGELDHPRVYELFQFPKGAVPEHENYWHNLFQVGVNLDNLGNFLFGNKFDVFKSGSMPEEEIKETLWEKIYAKIDPVIEVRAVDQGHIWAAQFVYFLGQCTHIDGLSGFLRAPAGTEFPFIQIKRQAQQEDAKTFYGDNRSRYNSSAKIS